MTRVLELGSYVLPAYAGMLLAEQGLRVEKWIHPEGKLDPVQRLNRGSELWNWLNDGKTLRPVHAAGTGQLRPGDFDLVVDNIRKSAWERWGIDPAQEAARLGVPWVSMRDEFDGRSFDAVTQARATMEHGPYLPVYLGDTSGGLWLAFKALTMLHQGLAGQSVLRQSSCLAKLVEGELMVPAQRGSAPPWDEPGTYGATEDGVRVIYEGQTVREPIRDQGWKWTHLHHDGTGRIII